MKLFSILLFIINSLISNAQEKCNSNYICRNSSYCGDDMTCFCSNGICKYGPGPIIHDDKYNINNTVNLRGKNNYM